MREMVDKPAKPGGSAKISQRVVMLGVDAKADMMGQGMVVVVVMRKEDDE